MSSKTDMRPIVRAHLQTLRNNRTNRPSVIDYFVQIGIPIALGAVMACTRTAFSDISALLTVVSILAGLSFALAIFVFEIRQSLKQKYRKDSAVLEIVDELFQNVIYSVLIGLISTGLGALSTVFAKGSTAELVFQVLAVVATSHFFIVLLMCLKRLNAVYRETTR